ncbi:MAG: PQQ-binding-like beta-propeller repeat protein [Planctomycetales bacterium]|nr:PQQ-binding-like beta-propeller repeat protein [Planctomycetales bacterium]
MKRADRRKTGTMRLAWAGRWVFVASVFVASSGVRLSELRGAEPGAAVRDETPADASRLGGLRLAEDRQVEQWLVAARGHLERRESAAAAAFLARVLNADEDSFIVMNSSLAVARDEAWTLTRRLADEVRSQLETDLDRVALDAWTVAKAGDSRDEIVALAARHRYSLPGLEALRRLAAVQRDLGQYESAAAAWSRVAEHVRATTTQRTAARMTQIECLVAANRLEEAVRECDAALRTELSPAVAISGRSVVSRVWLIARQQSLTDTARRANTLPLLKSGRPMTGIDFAPAPHVRWSRLTPLPADLTNWMSDAQQTARGHGVVSSWAVRPRVVGSVVVARTLEQLVALDLTSGAILWTKPHAEYATIADRSTALENVPAQNQFATSWYRRTEADSIFGSLTTDGRIVVAVMEPDRKLASSNRTGLLNGPGVANGPPVNSTAASESHWNRLVAYEVTTGELCWQIGGKPTGPADVYGGLRFLGPPLAVDDLWFGIARREDELKLLAIDTESGHLRWSMSLGELPPHLADAAAQRRIARPVSLVGGRLLCPTASGALIAVDPVTRGIAWAARYPVTQLEQSPRPVNGVGTGAVVDAWWNEWREVACLAESERRMAVLASPESDALHGIDVESGRVIWSVPRGGGIHLAGLCAGQVIVVEPMAVRAHDVRTGAVTWRCETGEVSGRGTILGGMIFQPRRAGSAVVIDARDGSPLASQAGAEPPLGTLVPCDGGWVSQTSASLVQLPWLAVSRETIWAKWNADPRDESAALELARLDLHAGQPAAARSRLLNIESAAVNTLRREVLLALLRTGEVRPFDQPDFMPVHRTAIGSELLELSESPDDKLVGLLAVGEAAVRDDDLVGAVTAFLDGIDLLDATARRSVGEWPADSAATRFVRRDRMFVGAIERTLAKAQLGQHDQPLEQLLDARLRAARKSSDPFAVQRLIDRLLPLAWGRRTLLTEATAVRFARTLKKTEPALLTVMQSRDETLARRAATQLAELFARSGWSAEADAIERRLLVEHPDDLLDPAPASAIRPDNDPVQNERRARWLAPLADPWPNVLPVIEGGIKTPNDDEVHCLPVRIEAAPGSLLDRLDVSIDRQAQIVRFAGDGHAGQWKVTLGGPRPALRSGFATQDQYEGWGVGRLLVLRVGTELFGIAPLDEKGEPHASIVWQIDTALGMSPSFSEEPIYSRVGVRHESTRLTDAFGRVLGRVGPVRPDYLCHQSNGRLVAIDTQTGKRLWERRDLPPQFLTFGDEDHVYLWREAERSLTVLSAVDGRTLGTQPWDADPDDVLLQRDGQAWLTTKTVLDVRVELRDASGATLNGTRDESLVWSKQFASKSVPFVLDRDTLGVIEPRGVLHLISARTGSPVGESLAVRVPLKLERIVCHRDDGRWYVAFSGPVDRRALFQAEQPWGGKRMPFINGPWIAIDRATKSIFWQRTIENEPLPLAASRFAPVFVQMWRQPLFDGLSPKGSEGRLKVIDKRTGREVLNRNEPRMQPYFVLHPSANRDQLDIRMEHETIRLRYEADAAPAKPD